MTDRKWFYVNGVVQVAPVTKENADIENGADVPFTEEEPSLAELEAEEETKSDFMHIRAPTWKQFCEAIAIVVQCSTNGPCKSYAHSRLAMLELQKVCLRIFVLYQAPPV